MSSRRHYFSVFDLATVAVIKHERYRPLVSYQFEMTTQDEVAPPSDSFDNCSRFFLDACHVQFTIIGRP